MAEPQIALPAPDIANKYRRRKAANPGARARDIAEALGVTEGILAEALSGDGVHRLGLRGVDFVGLLSALKDVGPVMTLTRNDTAVYETTGTMGAVSNDGEMGQVTGPIDLRLFLRHWHVGYAVSEETRSGLRHSIQVFDATGAAVIKIYAVAGTNNEIWDRIVEAHLDQSSQITAFTPRALPSPARPDGEIDVAALREGWLALEHSHDFHRLLAMHTVGREQALRLVGEDLAFRADGGLVERLLQAAAAGAVPIMCFVGSTGCLQIFSGAIERVASVGPWLNVLDPAFNLHLRTDRVASTWVVIKPTKLRGRITSLELFDAEHRLVCQFFGNRPPGEGEREGWRTLIDDALGDRS
ncbi:MAG: ChuX/HutX family heme-like substrate-binding protein [Pseudomonadota bacterium]